MTIDSESPATPGTAQAWPASLDTAAADWDLLLSAVVWRLRRLAAHRENDEFLDCVAALDNLQRMRALEVARWQQVELDASALQRELLQLRGAPGSAGTRNGELSPASPSAPPHVPARR